MGTMAFVWVVILVAIAAGGGLVLCDNSTSRSISSRNYLSDYVVDSTNPNDVRFFLYPNGEELSDSDELKYNDSASITASRFNSSEEATLIILAHGFTQNHTSRFPVKVKDAYLRAGFASHSNVVCVDWGKLSGSKKKTRRRAGASRGGNAPSPPAPVGGLIQLASYGQAMDNVPIVGKRIAEFILFLHANNFIAPPATNKIHLVGHSLGAHVAGMAGFHYQKGSAGGVRVGRITGTDPAFPGYQQKGRDERLDSTDGAFVDAVHTDSGELGEYFTVGTVDFFVNGGGPNQPECPPQDQPQSMFGWCSHNMAPLYFAKSISTRSIKACPIGNLLPPQISSATSTTCPEEQKIIFGEFCPNTARGVYGVSLTL